MDHALLEREYGNETHFLWHRQRPKPAEQATLRGVRPDNLFLDIGPASENCPLTSVLAKLRRQWDP
jgi:hypothetical protein